MEEKAKHIGELIHSVFLKSGMTVTEFTDKICCARVNYYKIKKKGRLDTDLLKKISEVLNHNFFADIANDIKLAQSNETDEERKDREAVSIFIEVVPKVLKKLKADFAMFYWQWDGDKNNPTPDWALAGYPISFTIGQTMAERYEHIPNDIEFKTLVTPDDIEIELCINHIHNFKCLNITIRKRTEEEWERLLDYTIKYAKQNGYKYPESHRYF